MRTESPRQLQTRRTVRGCLSKLDRKSTRLNSSHLVISYAVFCLKKKKQIHGNEVFLIDDARSGVRCVARPYGSALFQARVEVPRFVVCHPSPADHLPSRDSTHDV